MTAVVQPSWDNDADLLADLLDALHEPSQVPPEFEVAARGALAWRSIDADLALAELSFDSVSDVGAPTRAGLPSGTRILAFDGDGVSVEVEIAEDGITGQLSPPETCRVSCQTAAGTFDETDADTVGCFVLRAPPPGPVRLHLSFPNRRSVATTWLTLTHR